MVKHYDLDFVEVHIYDNYIIGTFSEGFEVQREHIKILLDFVNRHFKNKSFVYISNRKNSYSIDPTIYHEATKVENLIAVAIVSENKIQKTLSQLEKHFYDKKIKYFKTIGEAIDWKETLL